MTNPDSDFARVRTELQTDRNQIRHAIISRFRETITVLETHPSIHAVCYWLRIYTHCQCKILRRLVGIDMLSSLRVIVFQTYMNRLATSFEPRVPSLLALIPTRSEILFINDTNCKNTKGKNRFLLHVDDDHARSTKVSE